MAKFLSLTLVFVLFATLSASQETQSQSIDSDRSIAGFLSEKEHIDPPSLSYVDFLTPEGVAVFEQSLEGYYQYHVGAYTHRRAVFEWQLFSSKVIFGVVILIVLAGLYFSWVQFAEGLRNQNGEEKISTVEANATGIKVSSPLVGVVILTLSLAFFYLYLVHVYPIEELF